MTVVSKAQETYAKQFGEAPKFGAFAPGRVEIMGNHTDYNGGFVLPAALDKGTAIVGASTGTDEVVLMAADFGRIATFSVSDLQRDPQNTWADYVMGVVSMLQQDGVSIGGFKAVIASDVPAGAGLSSSAALEVSTAFFLRQLFPYDREPMQIARLCQRAENEYVGVACGILDQFSSVFGKQDSLLFLDCLSLEHGAVKMGRSDIAVVICDSMAKHALTGGDYNTRRAECMAAAAHFGKELLREVDWDEFVAREFELPENQRKRARHVLAEDKRVLAMRDAIQGVDTDPIKRLLIEGHESCRDLFENSTPEIDFLAAAAIEIEGCYGAKLTGGGWGGCTVNLVQVEAVPDFCAKLSERYTSELGKTAQIYPCRASAGAQVLEL